MIGDRYRQDDLGLAVKTGSASLPWAASWPGFEPLAGKIKCDWVTIPVKCEIINVHIQAFGFIIVYQ